MALICNSFRNGISTDIHFALQCFLQYKKKSMTFLSLSPFLVVAFDKSLKFQISTLVETLKSVDIKNSTLKSLKATKL